MPQEDPTSPLLELSGELDMSRIASALFVLGVAVHVNAWGNLGHETVGYV